VLAVGHVFNSRTHAAATDGIKTRLVTTMHIVLAIAVGLTKVEIIAVLAMAEVQLVHEVVQAVRKVSMMMSVAALVPLLAVLVQNQMVAHDVLQVVTRMLELANTMDVCKTWPPCEVQNGGQGEGAHAGRVGADGGQSVRNQDPRGSDRRYQNEIGGNDTRRRRARCGSDDGLDQAPRWVLKFGLSCFLRTSFQVGNLSANTI